MDEFFFQKKAQAWGIDLMIAMTIFSVAFLIIFIFSINISVQEPKTLDSMKQEGNNIMNSILSEGSPISWNTQNVKKIGILNVDNKINQTKLESFYNLSQNNYSLTRKLFNTKFDYALFFDNLTISGIEIESIGKNASLSNINSSNLIKVSRISIYNEKPVNIYLYLWD